MSFSLKNTMGKLLNKDEIVTVVEKTIPTTIENIIAATENNNIPLKKTSKKKPIVKIDSDGNTIVESNGLVDKGTLGKFTEAIDDLHGIAQMSDVLLSDVKTEINRLMSSNYKNKHNALPGYFDSASKFLQVKRSAINDVASIIKTSNDMDYKLAKDLKENEVKSDDQYLMELYKSMLTVPMSNNPIQGNIESVQRAPMPTINNNGAGVNIYGNSNYQEISANAQSREAFINTMYAINPNYKDVVVYNASDNSKRFAVLNTATGQLDPNAPAKNQIFMADTMIDLKSNTARNNNLGETYPVIVIDDPIASGKL